MGYKNLLIKKEEGIGWIIINRPDKLNALNAETIKELYEAFLSLQESSDVRVVIFTGEARRLLLLGPISANWQNSILTGLKTMPWKVKR